MHGRAGYPLEDGSEGDRDVDQLVRSNTLSTSVGLVAPAPFECGARPLQCHMVLRRSCQPFQSDVHGTNGVTAVTSKPLPHMASSTCTFLALCYTDCCLLLEANGNLCNACR